jgi:hypothetical protein
VPTTAVVATTLAYLRFPWPVSPPSPPADAQISTASCNALCLRAPSLRASSREKTHPPVTLLYSIAVVHNVPPLSLLVAWSSKHELRLSRSGRRTRPPSRGCHVTGFQMGLISWAGSQKASCPFGCRVFRAMQTRCNIGAGLDLEGLSCSESDHVQL